MNNNDFDKRFGILPYEYIEPEALVLGREPSPILGSITEPLFTGNEIKKNDEKIALKLEYKRGCLLLVDNLATKQSLKLTKFKNEKSWNVLIEPLLKSTNNSPTTFKVITEKLIRKNFGKKDNQVGLKDLNEAIINIDSMWKYLLTNVIEKEILDLFRVKTSKGLKFEFRSAISFTEIYALPKDDYRKLVKILKETSNDNPQPLQA